MSEEKKLETMAMLEAAESASTEAVTESKTDDEIRRLKKVQLIKVSVILFFVALVMIFATLGWFTMNKDTDASGMGVKIQATPYTIQTRSSSGTYSDVYESLQTDSMEWKISSEYNFDNHETAKKEGETEPGLEPGDHGILEFRVNPNNTNTITVDCVFDMKAYYQPDTPVAPGEPEPEITEITNSTLVGYIKAHIMLFRGIDANGKYTGLISTDEDLRRVLEQQTYQRNGEIYTKIYWVWPQYLSDLTSNNTSDLIYASSERSDVIAYIAANRNGFFKDCKDSLDKVTADLTALSTAYSSSVFNHYSIKYDNADLDIGNNITYVLLSMQVV